MTSEETKAAARRICAFFRDARRQSEAWAECDRAEHIARDNPDVAEWNRYNVSRPLDNKMQVMEDFIAMLIEREIPAAPRDVLARLERAEKIVILADQACGVWEHWKVCHEFHVAMGHLRRGIDAARKEAWRAAQTEGE